MRQCNFRSMENLKDREFGRLTVKRFVGRVAYHAIWECKCACGTMVKVRGSNLTKKDGTVSCGCARDERTRHANSTHGMSSTREYYIWRAMRARCREHPDYVNRGITVCARWETSFEAFIRDMGSSPGEGYTIDRRDNDKGYYKGNCRWVSQKVNNRNKRNNRLLTHDGKTQCMAAWAEETGISRETIAGRLKRGWTVAEALSKSLPN